ncbi:hexamerin-1.1-like [Lutzomyia longipalpis]|uniref:hexamerin-1.1-like n=1 Tax=Lutzomyia longipalpis TaxID=7200 RepID=UPI0024842800|nr:hexamerin-1.1-like [Lutzomyia longipalpis]XP_055696123.1 hexamerin-1.1-like [Lutzomyia longipalpis]
MRSITIFVLACATLALGYVVPGTQVKYADKEFLYKQKALFEVLQHVHQHEIHTTLWDEAKAFKFEDYFDHYTNVTAVKEFYAIYKYGMLPFDEVFSVLEDSHKYQVISLFNVFYYAKDWDTFYKSVVWARFHVNEGMFVYALTAAVLHRPDFAGLELPAPYEIYPYYFFSSDVIAQAQQYKMQGFYGMKKVEDVYTVIIPSNYTGAYVHTTPDQKLSYFTEDIGLNSYYYYYHMDYPFWMGGKEFGLYKDRRGENYLFFYQQILARYYLERLSNDLGHIPEFSWYEPIYTGYYPNLRYYNGAYFPSRPNYFNFYTEEYYYDIDTLWSYEQRIRDAIDLGFIYLPDGTHVDLTKPESIEYLGNLIQGNPDSVNTRFYKYIVRFAKILLGNTYDFFGQYSVVPSVLEHFETAMRDPLFYQLYKKIIKFYWQFKDKLPPYTVEELYFPGVKIEGVEVDKLVTYFDKFDADITNAVDIEVYDEKLPESQLKKFGKIAHYQGEDFVIKARQSRLNHLPFTVKLTVQSEKAVKSVVRIYLGPKVDEYGVVYDVNENRENFFLLDVFPYDLSVGKNVIVRDSVYFGQFVKDRTTYFDLYKWVMTAYNGETKFPLDMTEAHNGFPSRLMLPKGKKGGYPYQFYFIVSPYHAPSVPQYTGYDHYITAGVGSGAKYVDSLPFGYPFDRKINEYVWYTPNMYYHDVFIFHKKEADVNTVY